MPVRLLNKQLKSIRPLQCQVLISLDQLGLYFLFLSMLFHEPVRAGLNIKFLHAYLVIKRIHVLNPVLNFALLLLLLEQEIFSQMLLSNSFA